MDQNVMLIHSMAISSWKGLQDVKEINSFKPIQIIVKFSKMTFRDLKCYRILWKLIIISIKSISFFELIKAKRTSEKNNSSAIIGLITLERAFWFSGFTEILKSYFSWIQILSLNKYSVAWNEKKLQKGKGLLWRAYW